MDWVYQWTETIGGQIVGKHGKCGTYLFPAPQIQEVGRKMMAEGAGRRRDKDERTGSGRETRDRKRVSS